MKKLATAIAAIALIGTPAFAADMAVKMPVKAPPPPPAPIYSWTGFYVGGSAGYSWGNVNTNLNGSPVFADVFDTTGALIGTSQVTSGYGFSDRTHPDGFIGGALAKKPAAI